MSIGQSLTGLSHAQMNNLSMLDLFSLLPNELHRPVAQKKHDELIKKETYKKDKKEFVKKMMDDGGQRSAIKLGVIMGESQKVVFAWYYNWITNDGENTPSVIRHIRFSPHISEIPKWTQFVKYAKAIAHNQQLRKKEKMKKEKKKLHDKCQNVLMDDFWGRAAVERGEIKNLDSKTEKKISDCKKKKKAIDTKYKKHWRELIKKK
tara:strand:+ start:8813 stop:9430 length:618 start_codon:yes stop_codon:yes gene_type:complete